MMLQTGRQAADRTRLGRHLGRPRRTKAWPLTLAPRAASAVIGLTLSLSALAETYTARVVGVTDGDTIKVLDGRRTAHKIRLAGIDAPEKAQPYGQRSKRYLADQVYGRTVTLDCGELDRYKRLLCVVLLDGRDINLSQVQAGYAWWYQRYSRMQTLHQRQSYEEAELAARARRAGLWRDNSQSPPWEWRKRARRA